MRFSSFFFATALLISQVALADEAFQLDVLNKPFNPQKDVIINTVNTDAKYSEITQSDRTSIEVSLLKISEILTSDKKIEALDVESQESIKLNQEAVNKLLLKAFRDSRMVCTKEAPVGSNRMKRVCKTAAARSRDNATVRANGIKVNQ